jgi:hypothetical protein
MSESQEKKIIIDDDWKSQVQAEKEAAEAARKAKQAERPQQSGAAQDLGDHPLPPADFPTIVSMLATQVMLSLGALPNPISGKAEVHLNQARHFIDLIEVLQEKTKGNCTPQESQMMKNLLHELRMSFVAVQNRPPQQAAEPAGEEPAHPS